MLGNSFSDPGVPGRLSGGVRGGAINGSGSSNEPTGILATAGVGLVEADATNGAAMTWQDALDLIRAIRAGNGDTSTIGFLTNPDLEAKLSATEKATNTVQFIYESTPGSEFGMIAGRRVGITTTCPNDGSKGSGTALSTIIAGCWSELLVGYWGAGLDVVVDPYSKRTTRLVGITVSNFCDIAVRHPVSFCALTDAVTV